MIAEERIITAVDVHSGEYVDGTECSLLLDRTKGAGVKVEALSGDKAYFKKEILDELERIAKLIGQKQRETAGTIALVSLCFAWTTQLFRNMSVRKAVSA